MNMVCCGGCGRTIESKFFYCPWCGFSRIDKTDEEGIKLRCQQYKNKKLETQLSKVEKLQKSLDELERELGVLSLSVEMHK